jgi:hypothetical protein
MESCQAPLLLLPLPIIPIFLPALPYSFFIIITSSPTASYSAYSPTPLSSIHSTDLHHHPWSLSEGWTFMFPRLRGHGSAGRSCHLCHFALRCSWSSYFPMVYEDSGFERLTISYLDGSNTAGAGNSWCIRHCRSSWIYPIAPCFTDEF